MLETRNFDKLIGKVKGLSEKQLTQHFGLYNGYVKKYNEIIEKLSKSDISQANYSFGEFSELKRREVVAFNGAKLHELYFDNLMPNGEPSKELKKAIEAAFGSMEKFEANMKASATSTPGWVLLTRNSVDGKLHSYIMFEHHIGLPVHQEIVLALDCWEHAFMIDYGTNKAEYLKVFFENINWDVANKRFENIKKI